MPKSRRAINCKFKCKYVDKRDVSVNNIHTKRRRRNFCLYELQSRFLARFKRFYSYTCLALCAVARESGFSWGEQEKFEFEFVPLSHDVFLFHFSQTYVWLDGVPICLLICDATATYALGSFVCFASVLVEEGFPPRAACYFCRSVFPGVFPQNRSVVPLRVFGIWSHCWVCSADRGGFPRTECLLRTAFLPSFLPGC